MGESVWTGGHFQVVLNEKDGVRLSDVNVIYKLKTDCETTASTVD